MDKISCTRAITFRLQIGAFYNKLERSITYLISACVVPSLHNGIGRSQRECCFHTGGKQKRIAYTKEDRLAGRFFSAQSRDPPMH